MLVYLPSYLSKEAMVLVYLPSYLSQEAVVLVYLPSYLSQEAMVLVYLPSYLSQEAVVLFFVAFTCRIGISSNFTPSIREVAVSLEGKITPGLEQISIVNND